MIDRELLVLAAKAAGYKQYITHHCGRNSFVVYDEEVYSGVKERRVIAEKTMDWNPLTSDSDALRLAVRLGLTIYCPHKNSAFVGVGETPNQFLERPGTDPCAATRRVIVRAAAAIGEGK